MEKTCRLCNRRRAEPSEYCIYHRMTFESLKGAFERWRHALDIDWDSYLNEVCKNPETGEWAKEVALSLLSHEPTGDPVS